MSDYSDISFAIVGPGAIGDVHASALAELGIRVNAVVGTVPDQVSEFAAKHDVRTTYRALHDLLGDDTVQAVIVATPSHLHATQTLELLDAGKNVLSEIPLALTQSDAEAVADRAATTGRIAMGGHTLRYWEPHRRLQEILADRDIDPSHVVVRSMMLRHSNVGWTGRQRDWTDSVLWHHGGHAIDAALWHLRDPGPITVAGARGAVWPESGKEMDIAALLTTADRRMASVTLSYHSRIPVTDFLVVSEEHTLLITEGRLLLDDTVVFDAGSVAAAQSAAVIAQDEDFARAVACGGVPVAAAEHLLPAMQVLQALADMT